MALQAQSFQLIFQNGAGLLHFLNQNKKPTRANVNLLRRGPVWPPPERRFEGDRYRTLLRLGSDELSELSHRHGVGLARLHVLERQLTGLDLSVTDQ